ncbi:MAG: AAA family ATPase [Desulfobacteraceae bacterium]|nr:AAA family ATPase [Desulfobacteraceae bacterium]
MRINHLIIKNFKGFKDNEFLFHPQFNLIVGANGTGKTSLLDALSVAMGSWFLGFKGYDTRNIKPYEVLLKRFDLKDLKKSDCGHSDSYWEYQYPCSVEAFGKAQGKELSWMRTRNTAKGRTTHADAAKIKELAEKMDKTVRSGGDAILPLIAYYGTGRLWNEPREQAQVKDEKNIARKETLSRLSAYRNCIDPRLSVSELTRWIVRQSWISYQKGSQSSLFKAVLGAIVNCVEGAHNLYFDADFYEVIVNMSELGNQPFNNLSDGQRCMFAMVGDIAQKAATLNPHMRSEVLKKTPGVVLIDELDIHLHPKWQRRVIDDLRRTFPKIQFFATTHSPFLIQALCSGEELIMLDGQPAAQLANKPLEEIVQGIMGVSDPQVSMRYQEMKSKAKHYLETLEQAAQAPEDKLAEFKEKLAQTIGPYADNPAFQAFLEMKRSAKLGE